MVNLHVIGDSHARLTTWGGVECVSIISHWLGPVTCASFGMQRLLIDIGLNDWVCFCFGEIDCRNHLGKHINWRDIAVKIVDNYFESINCYKAEKIFVFSIVPANIQATAPNPWPCVGTDQERRMFVKYMNELYKDRCSKYGFIFLDVHDKYADENGFFNLKYRDFCGHIADSVFINEFLNEIIEMPYSL